MSHDPSVPGWLSDAIGGLKAGDVDAWMEVYSDDAVHEFPFAPAGAPPRLEGKATIRAFMAGIGERIRFGTFDVLRVMQAGDEVVVEAEGHHHDAATGAPFDLRYVWIFTRRDGRVARVSDYMGPRRSSDGRS